MAKEKAPDTGVSRPELQGEVVARKKKKKRKDSDATGSKGKKRPKFCPNSSKNGNRSFNLSRSRVLCRASETALKKNNEQLAKALNSHKITIGELRAELVLKDRRIQEVLSESASLRLSVDPALVEAELLRRVAAAVAPIRASLEGAVDCLVQTSEHVTKGLQLASQPSRQSSISQARLSMQQPRHSSIGPTFRMRSVAPSSESANSTSPSLVSKVGPMVAGHAISRPRIQLTRMDDEAMAAARERQAQDLGLAPAPADPQPQVDDPVAGEEEEEYDDIGASPEHPGRSRFNMTNIVEESRLEESRLEVSGVLEEEDEEDERIPGLQTLPEEPPVSLTTPTLDRSLQPMVRLSPCHLSPLEQATPSRYRLSVGRGITPRNQIPPQPTAATSQATSSQPTVKTSLRRAPRPAAPPAAIRLSISQPSTPLAPSSPAPAAACTTSPAASPFIPDNPSESFLEALAQDPGEGPSWLFADKGKKKKRSSTARQLSALFSESERESGATTGASTSGMDTSDISLEGPDSADSSAEVSGFILAEDLRQSKSAVFSTAPSTPALAVANEEEQKDMDEDEEEQKNMDEEEEEQAEVNKENSAEEESPSRLSISVSATPGRRPLEEVAIDGGVVTYCPRLETGATIASLRTASILLKNVGTKGSTTEESTTPYRLSECYVAVSPGRSMSLDQLLSLGLRAGLEEGRSPSIPTRAKGNKRPSSPGRRHQGNVGSPGKRMPNSPGKRSLGNFGKRSFSGQESPLSKRARSCAIGRRIYSEEDPVEEDFGAHSSEMNHNHGLIEKTNQEESSVGLVGEASNNLDRDEEENAAILEMVPEDRTDKEVFMHAENDGQRNIEKDQQETLESCSRGTSREFSRQGRARNSVVYTESPVMEKKRMSKKEEGGRRNPKSGRVSPLDMNTVADSTEEVLPKKKQSSLSNQNVKKAKEDTSKKVSLVKAGGSKRAMEKAEQEEKSDAGSVEKAKDLDQAASVSRESSVGEIEEAAGGTSRGRRARAQVSYALPSLNTKMRRNQ